MLTKDSLWPHLIVNLGGFAVLFAVALVLLALDHGTPAVWCFGAAIGWGVRGVAWALVEYHLAKKRPRYRGDLR